MVLTPNNAPPGSRWLVKECVHPIFKSTGTRAPVGLTEVTVEEWSPDGKYVKLRYQGGSDAYWASDQVKTEIELESDPKMTQFLASWPEKFAAFEADFWQRKAESSLNTPTGIRQTLT